MTVLGITMIQQWMFLGSCFPIGNSQPDPALPQPSIVLAVPHGTHDVRGIVGGLALQEDVSGLQGGISLAPVGTDPVFNDAPVRKR